jgi:hypothetical protein
MYVVRWKAVIEETKASLEKNPLDALEKAERPHSKSNSKEFR